MPLSRKLWQALAAGTAFLALGASANAAKPCWQQVIDDWVDNSRVDRLYPIHCYREALANLPEDMRAYSSAPEDIERAMRAAILLQQQDEPELEPASQPQQSSGQTSPPPATGSQAEKKKPTKKSNEERANAPRDVLRPPAAAPNNGGPFADVLDEIGPSDSRSFPLPVLAVGSLALLLTVAAVASLLSRRIGKARAGREHRLSSGRPPPTSPR